MQLISSWRAKLRIGWRLAALFCGTMFYWGCLTVDSWMHRRTAQIDLINKWVPRWARFLIRVFSGKVAATGPFVGSGRIYPGRDAQGVGRIFICNHRSSIDIPVMFTLAEAHAISRHDLADWAIIGRGAKRVGTLFVDRQSRRSGANVLKQVNAALASGEGVMMFPEGTSFMGDQVQPFRPGAFKAAKRAGAEIVPVGIAYDTEDVYYYNETFVSHVSRFARVPSVRVAAAVGEPISPEGLDPVQMRETAHRQVQQLVNRARQQLGGEPMQSPRADAAKPATAGSASS